MLRPARRQRRLCGGLRSGRGFGPGHLAAVAAPHAWRDVTVGNNKCTEANRGCDSGACEPGCEDLCPGYEAAKGWDPVTGWGTPHAGALLDAFAEL